MSSEKPSSPRSDFAVASASEGEVTYMRNAIKELELADDHQIGSCVKDMFDNHDTDLFLRLLSDRISGHDAEIANVSHHHFEGFMDTFRQLMQVKTEATQVKDQIQTGNATLVDACEQYISKLQDVSKVRQFQSNIKQTLDVLDSSMPVFEAYRNLKNESVKGEYHNVLKILGAIETMMGNISDLYWAQSVRTGVDHFKTTLLDRCVDELKTFLEKVATRSHQIGILAMMRSAADSSLFDAKRIMDFARFDSYGDAKEFVKEKDTFITRLQSLSIDELIDFLPVYKGIHVFDKLKSMRKLSDQYKRDKRKQLLIIMDTSSSSTEKVSQIVLLSRFLFRTLGFFVVEDYILHSTEQLITVQFYNELRNKAVQKMIAVCANSTMQCKNADEILDIKDLLSLLSITVQDYGFDSSPIADVLLDLRNIYFDEILSHAEKRLRILMDEENYASMVIDGKGLEKMQKNHACLLKCSLPTLDCKTAKFPINLPFSPLVPKLHSIVYEVLEKMKNFYATLSPSELWQHIYQPLESLFVGKFGSCFNSLVSDRSRTLTQLIQLSINAHYLSEFSGCLRTTSSQILRSDLPHFGSEHCDIFGDVFTVFFSCALDRVIARLKSSVDQFLELSSYDWVIAEPTGMASSYITDLLQFFRTTFVSFVNLPKKLFFPTLNITCRHIASSLERNLLDPDVKAISFAALEQLELDLIQCEQFAMEMCKTNEEVDEVMSSFTLMRQLLDLTLTKDWTTYFAEYGLEDAVHYNTITANVARDLVDKLKEGLKRGKGYTLPFRQKSVTEKDEKRLLNTVSEELSKLAS